MLKGKVENETLIIDSMDKIGDVKPSYNIYRRWTKPIYIASRIEPPTTDDYGNEIYTYNEPIKYNINVQPASGYTDIQEFGESIKKVFKAVVPYRLKYKIKEGDIAYLDGATPIEEHEGTYGSTGNFVVDSVRPQNLATTIYFKKIEK
jgi:hypothetical protein